MIRVLAWGYLAILLLVPVAGLFASALSGGVGPFLAVLGSRQTLFAIGLTVGVALVATIVNVAAGALVAWALVRGRVPGRRLLESLLDLPLALPAVVAGLALLALYGAGSPLGLRLVTTPWAILAALLFVTLPLTVRSFETGFRALAPDAEAAAETLGADRGTVFRRVVWPSVRPATTGAAVLCFARCLGEFGAVILVAGNVPLRTEVASYRIYALNESGDPAGAAAVATVLLLASGLALLALERRPVAAR